MEITGTIISGLGEGASYMKRYHQALLEALGFQPFPGTLNLTIPSVPDLFENAIQVTPPEHGLFPILCRNAIINDKLRGAIIRPLKTAHPREILEVIAPQNIKEYFSLGVGDKIRIRVT